MSPSKIQTHPRRSDDIGAAGRLAHALTDSLNGLLAMSELLERQALAEPARAQLQAMRDAGRRMAALLCDAIETVDAAVPAVLAPVCLRELLDDVDARWRTERRTQAAQVLISSNAPADLRLMADAVRLRRLLNTLIEDALRASAWGVVELQLQVHVGEGGMITVAGRLDAPGAEFSACDPVAFDLCSTLVEQMDGELITSPGAGSGVDIRFTFQAPEAGCRQTASVETDEQEGPLPAHTHILIVDDNATNRIVASALCEMFGCTSETADDGLEAVEAVKSRHFDLILMDIKMPRMDGMEATKAIRALPTTAARTPIVALTANADPQSSAAYVAGGMQAVVDKPIKPEQLLSTLQWVLGESSGEPAKASSAA